MFTNGVLINTKKTITRTLQSTIHKGLNLEKRYGCFGEAVGMVLPDYADRQIVTTTCRLAPITTMDSG